MSVMVVDFERFSSSFMFLDDINALVAVANDIIAALSDGWQPLSEAFLEHREFTLRVIEGKGL